MQNEQGAIVHLKILNWDGKSNLTEEMIDQIFDFLIANKRDQSKQNKEKSEKSSISGLVSAKEEFKKGYFNYVTEVNKPWKNFANLLDGLFCLHH